MKRFWLLGWLLCASCSGPYIAEFRVRSINTDEEEIPCVVFRDEQLVVDETTNAPVLTPAQLKIAFPPRRDGGDGYQSVKLGVRAVELDAEGKVVGDLTEEEASPYVEDSRFVHDDDAPTQLFVLRRNKDYGG